MKVDGACHCGAVKFAAQINPARIGICHCTDCQIFSGSAFRLSVLVKEEDFQLLEGNPATYEKVAESGSRRQLLFCDRCGTHLFGTTATSSSKLYSVRIGVLEQRAELRPAAQIWCRSEVSWLVNLAGIPRVSTQ